MTDASRARKGASAVLRRVPVQAVPSRLRPRALEARARTGRSLPLNDLSGVATATLIAVLTAPPNAALRARTASIAAEIARRKPKGRLGVLAVDALLRAGRLDELRSMLPADATIHGAAIVTVGELEEELAAGHRRPTDELLRALGGGRRAELLLVDIAAAADAWDLVAETAPRVADASLLYALAKGALRSGQLTAAMTLHAASTTHGGQRRKSAAFDRAADRIRFNALDLSSLSVTADPEPFERRDNAILYVASQSLPHRSGGYATRTHGIVTALDQAGWDVRVLTRLGFPSDRADQDPTKRVADHDVVDGIEYWRSLRADPAESSQVPMERYVREAAKDIMRHAREHGASVIHSASFFQTGLPAALAAQALGIPFVYELRGLQELFMESRDPRLVTTEEYAFWRRAETEVMRRADVVLCITAAIARDVESRGIPRDKLKVLANGVWPQDFQPAEPDAELKAQLGLEGKAVIGYAGSVVDYEGLELLCDAVEILARERDDLALVIVGDGPASQELRGRVAGSASEPLVTFVGRVPHTEVPRYLSLFDVMPFPRLPLIVCEEVSPMKPFEAMAMGKAVVVSSVAALTEIVTHDVDGLAFAKGDAVALSEAIARLIDDPELRARLGAAARRTIETEAAWSARVRSAEAAYRELTIR